ncbi:HDOD domain-containing protein [Wenzhouxiangella limi]|uniref:HDOD domain-containing protein n=1 Tax=Wenzhouxiangella limi TaxID=2707351 RepID=A0A845VDK7_9GAMM|nr:HDOD domain-containing protein [Wenzhouxiangella limi]NDY95349.1 HDOD domain-containing protein [Wenzhouxiangella limi]
MLTPRIKTALRFCPDLPTPPGIAMQIVDLARDPEVDLSSLVEMLSQDPALAARLMRASNSCLFARRRKSESLRQAIVVIGLNATMTLALSFSLARTLQQDNADTEGIERSWRRVLIASCAARLIGSRLRRRDSEELALAALLQDIGILALRAALPEEYRPLLEEARDHEELVRLERERLGADHAEAGSWLMAHWKLPEKLVNVPVCVHGRSPNADQAEHAVFFAVVEVAGKVADLLLGDDTGELTEELMRTAAKLDDLDRAFLESLLTEISERLPEMAELYDTEIIAPQLLTGIIDQARQAMADRQVMANREAYFYEQRVASHGAASAASAQAAEAVVESPPMELLDERLDLEFRRATTLGHPLSLAFVRLDERDELVSRHGPNDVEAVLQVLRRRLARLTGQAQLVFSSAPDEFVVLLPGVSRSRAHDQLERLRAATAGEDFYDADEEPFRVTLSIGLACHMDESQLYGRAIELLGAADQAIRGPDGEGGNTLTMAC